MTSRTALSGSVAAGAALVLIGLPLVTQPYQVERFASTITLAVAVLSLVLLTGWSGQISLGHSAFIGVGAYTTVILVADHGWPHLAALAAAAVGGGLCGAVAGLPGLRVKGVYLALVSLSLATLFPSVVQHFDGQTGGSQGRAMPAFDSWADSLAPDQWGYYVALAVAAPCFWLAWNLSRSRTGWALRAIRDNETAAQAMGINVAAHKVIAFAVSGALAGVAGSLMLLVKPYPYVDSHSFTIALSIALVTALVVGGSGSVLGALIGALFLERVPTLMSGVGHLDGRWTNLFYGVLLILLVRVMPRGVTGLVRSAADRLRSRRPPPIPRRAGTPAPTGHTA